MIFQRLTTETNCKLLILMPCLLYNTWIKDLKKIKLIFKEICFKRRLGVCFSLWAKGSQRSCRMESLIYPYFSVASWLILTQFHMQHPWV